ncbi:hypothetical protein [Streptomyces sp. NPDC047000]|uniref:hypothetical protein n=1 Tax=Streptomyces sp. NPDC047000 TaxID=3155474 RepID=UPI0033E665BB
MQISDTVKYTDGNIPAETAAQDHPLGEARLGSTGTLGLRSRLLRAAGHGPIDTPDLPYTTGTFLQA